MLDRLPVELLRLVLEHLAPLSFTGAEYRRRQSTLAACCVVARTFREVAQPLLRQAVLVGGEDAFEDVESVEAIEAALVVDPQIVAQAHVLTALYVERTALLRLGQRLSKLDEVRIRGHEDIFDAGDLARCFPSLRHIALDEVVLSCAALTGSFRFLRSLDLRHAHTTCDTLKTILSPVMTPSLGALRLASLNDDASFTYRTLMLDLSSCTHLERLDLVQLNVDHDTVALFPSSLAVPLLCEIQPHEYSADELEQLFGVLDTLHARHLQFSLPLDSDRDPFFLDHTLFCLNRLTTWIAVAEPSLRTLSLPPAIHASRAPPTLIVQAVAALVSECGRRKVELSWRWGSSPEQDQWLNHDFRRYARRLKDAGGEKV
ncbi:hypothetical protein JCM8097_005314 [Rhodosporidiobolus ruineniae]